MKRTCKQNVSGTFIPHLMEEIHVMGGTLKGCAYKHLMRSDNKGSILNAEQFYKQVSEKCPNITCIFVSAIHIHSTTFL